MTKKLIRIPVEKVKIGSLFFVDENEMPGFIIFHSDDGYKVIKNICPHMGAFFSRKDFSPEKNELRCPWHGYVFSLQSNKLIENPNVNDWIKDQVPCDSHFLKLRNFKLLEVTSRLENEEIVFEGSEY